MAEEYIRGHTKCPNCSLKLNWVKGQREINFPWKYSCYICKTEIKITKAIIRGSCV